MNDIQDAQVISESFENMAQQANLKTMYFARFQELRDLQAQFPFLPIDPPIGNSQTKYLPAGTCVEFPIPPNAKMFRISSAGNLQILMARSSFQKPDSSYSELSGGGIIVMASPQWRFAHGTMGIWLMALQEGFASVEYYIE